VLRSILTVMCLSCYFADSFWEHRFGKIRTLWAGTADHALSNWAGHDHIWLHFDRHTVKDAVDANTRL